MNKCEKTHSMHRYSEKYRENGGIRVKYVEVKMNTNDTRWEKRPLQQMTIFLSIEKGELVIILGPSGAGKSTILNILGGMDTPDEGQIIIDNTDIAQFSDKQLTAYRRTDVGFVFQFYNLVPNLTAKENVELATEVSLMRLILSKY